MRLGGAAERMVIQETVILFRWEQSAGAIGRWLRTQLLGSQQRRCRRVAAGAVAQVGACGLVAAVWGAKPEAFWSSQ